MKKITSLAIIKTLMVFAFLFSFRESIAQQPYECKIQNITYVSPTVLEFDVYIKNTGTSTLLFNSFQAGIDFNYVGMAGTGTITGAFVPGSNTLPAPQNNPNWNINATSKQIRLIAAIVTTSTSAAPITSTPLMLGKFRMTNTVPFTSCATPNFSWSFLTAANKTKTAVTAWVNGGTSPASITDPNHAAATFANGGGPQHYVASNPAVTCCPTAATYVGTNPVCFGGTGSAVVTITGAAASTSGTYTVDGGSAISFSANPFTVSGLTTGSHNVQITPATCTVIPLTVVTGGPTSPLTNTTTASACNTYTWAVNGLTYTQSGTYSGTSTNVNGCTVNETLNLTINTGTTTTTSACGTYTWSANNQTYTSSGTYTSGCNTLNLTINTGTSTTASACGTYTWSANNQTYTTSGIYTSGCNTLNLTINSSSSGTTTATACDSYIWATPLGNGNTYTSSTTATNVSTNAAGCPHTQTLNLTINNSTSGTTTATACDSYVWAGPLGNGNTYTASNSTATNVTTNAAGCPHTQTLNLTINNSTSGTTTATACDSYVWATPLGNGNTYTASTTATNVTTNASGCSHTQSLNLTINNSTSGTTTATACNSYVWSGPLGNGNTYTASNNTATNVTTNAAGCPHTQTLNLTINSGTTTTANACGAYTWLANNQTYNTSGTYTSGCDILNLTITTVNNTTATACDTYTWSVNNQTYTTSGTYTSGCNNLNLTINASTSATTSATSCNTYTWSVNGLTYTNSGTYTFTGTNAAGCPHVATLNLTINSSSSSITNATSCDTYTWSANGLTYTTSGTYTATSTNASGCPHLATLNLTVNSTTTSTTNASACDSYVWSVNGQTYTTSGTYTATTINASGCPDLATLNLTINTSTSSSASATACDTYTWPLSGLTYTSSGTYTNTGTNTSGCPQITTLNLTINTSSSSITTATACDSYTWSADGQTYALSGTYTATSTNAAGCPHVANLNLTINLSTSSSTSANACNSYTWAVNGLTYTNSGTYTYTGTNAAGCPHVYTLNLTISSSTNNTTTASACDTYNWVVNGQTYTQSGTYTSVTGCAVETLNLTITPSSSSSSTVSACDNYTWAVNGITYTQSGTYTNISNCVTKTLNLTLNTSSSQTQVQNVCGSYTWPINGQTYTQSGTYSATINCVTTTLNLTVTPSTSNTTTTTACGTYTWSVNGQTYTQSGTYTSVTGCNTQILVLTVNSTQGTVTTAAGCGSYTWPLNGQTYTQSGIYTFVTGCATNTLNLIITASANVANLQAINITGISAVANWSLISGIGWYEARWRPVGSGTWTSGTTNGSQKNIINLTPNTTYELQVRGFCSLNNAGGWSPSVNFTTNIVCDVPVNVVGVSTVGNQATISWTNVPGAGFYNLRYRIAAGGPWILVTNVTNPKQLNNLVPNTTYNVQVQSGCMGGNALSPWSVLSTFTTALPCSEPTGLAATNITTTTAKLNWLVPTGATYYTLRYRKVGNTNWNTGSCQTASKTINGLSAGQQYEWQVRTNCGNAVSAWSLTSVFTTNLVKTLEEEQADLTSISADVNIFPNPTHDELNVEFTVLEYTQTLIKVVDMSGRTVKQIQLNAETGKNLTSISLGDLANGLYSLQIIGNDRLLQVSRINKN